MNVYLYCELNTHMLNFKYSKCSFEKRNVVHDEYELSVTNHFHNISRLVHGKSSSQRKIFYEQDCQYIFNAMASIVKISRVTEEYRYAYASTYHYKVSTCSFQCKGSSS